MYRIELQRGAFVVELSLGDIKDERGSSEFYGEVGKALAVACTAECHFLALS
jgi:hypothetical protein